MSEKRKRVVVTMEKRLSVLKRIDKGESVMKICSELNVGKSTVNDWRRDRRSIEDFCAQMESDKNLKTRCTKKKTKFEIVDEALWLWFLQERRRGTPISGPILREKALCIHSKIIDGGEFIASEGWLTRWKARHGVHFAQVSGEKMSADASGATDFTSKFVEIIKTEKLKPEQVYNMDETGLNFKMLPEKTFLGSHEKSAAGFKKNKERITVAVCSNAAGTHKIPLFVVGKSAKPRAFKNLHPSSLPVFYRSQKSAWMSADLFKEWFEREFVPRVTRHLKSANLPTKAVLLLDNAPTHPGNLTCETDDIKIIFLPPNVTSLVQPMDQGVIESLKRRYRRKLLSEILQCAESEDLNLIDIIKKINLKDVIYMLASAFQEIPASTFVKSWRKLWPNIEELVECYQQSHEEDNSTTILQDLQTLSENVQLQAEDIEQWMNCDEDLENEFLTDDEIITLATHEEPDENEDEETDDDNVEGEEKVGHTEARAAMEVALKYIEQQPGSSSIDVLVFKKWRDIAFKNSLNVKKQKKVTDFFKTSL